MDILDHPQSHPDMEQRLYLGVVYPGDNQRVAQDEAALAKANSAFKRMRPLILERDNYVCQGCGYHAVLHKWMEVHHRDGDHRNNCPQNLMTYCHYCHRTQHLWEAMNSGALLIKTELPQAAFSRLARCAPWLDRRSQKAMAEWARDSHKSFLSAIGEQEYQRLPEAMQALMVQDRREGTTRYQEMQRGLYAHGVRMVFPYPGYDAEHMALRRQHYREEAEALAEAMLREA